MLIIISLLSLLAASCGFLEEKSDTRLLDTHIYNAEDGLESALYGCYKGLMGSSGPTNSMQEFLQTASGLEHWRYATNTVNDETRLCCLRFTQYSENAYNYNAFTGFYSTIQRCNTLLDHLPDSPVAEDVKAKAGGEARLIRALSYFYLVRLYGDVPVYLSAPASYEQGHSPRVPFWEVYKIIIDDLEYAETHMCEMAEASTASGRSCRWAATALKSSVYLTIGTLLASPSDNFWDTSKRTPDFSPLGINNAGDAFEKALTAADKVIAEGPYELAGKYSDLFRWTDPGDWNLKERIIVLTNSPQAGSNMSALRSLPRYINSATDGNKNYGRFRPTRFLFQKWCETYPGTKEGDIYVTSADPRLDASFFHTSFHDYGTGAERSIYPTASKLKLSTPQDKVYQPYFKKYYDPSYNGDAGLADFYVLRLAEVYLISAEAAARLSSAKGDDMWNKAFARVETLHERARKDAPALSATLKWESSRFADKNALLDGIFWERVFELSGEGHEFFDTHRMGATWLSRVIATEKNAFLKLPEQADFKSGTKTYDGYTTCLYGKDFQYETDVQALRKSLLCAFPYDEIVYNQGITDADQNDYYWK